ncbi:MAG TPA: FkbM family methyltransferase [Sphingomonas sp.]|nr:FkbM family methyltransferase [Sphingomonas sp.]
MLRRLKMRLDRTVRRRVFAKDIDTFVPAFNRFNPRFFHYPIWLDYEAEDGLIKVVADGADMFIGRPRRTAFYRKGIEQRLTQVAAEYFLDRVPIRRGDLVIDVGANIGELSKIVAASGARTISIEPEPVEVAALRRNLAGHDSVIVPQAVWKEETDLTFFSKNDTGDSSLIEMNGFESLRTIRATTLDTIYREHGRGQQVRLLKLEAEGAEPEILEGASEMLAYVDYVSADLGPERGVRCENTVAPVAAFLMDNGFRPIAFGHARGVMLFERVADQVAAKRARRLREA